MVVRLWLKNSKRVVGDGKGEGSPPPCLPLPIVPRALSGHEVTASPSPYDTKRRGLFGGKSLIPEAKGASQL